VRRAAMLRTSGGLLTLRKVMFARFLMAQIKSRWWLAARGDRIDWRREVVERGASPKYFYFGVAVFVCVSRLTRCNQFDARSSEFIRSLYVRKKSE
jgi:hypothetical protein